MSGKGKKNMDEPALGSKVVIEGKEFRLPKPDRFPEDALVPRAELLDHILPACLGFGGLAPLNFRLYGPQGEGKTTLVFQLAKILNKDVYIIQGREDMRAMDVGCKPWLDEMEGQIVYVASKLFAAMHFGQIALFDEIAKSPPEALELLLPVLDRRRSLECEYASFTLTATPGFLFCATLTEDEETNLNWKEEFNQRMKPCFYVPRFSNEERLMILKHYFPEANALWLDCFASCFKDEELSTRESISLFQYALNFHMSKYGQVQDAKKAGVFECMKKAAELFVWEPKDKLSARSPDSEEEAKHHHDIFHLIRKEGSVH